MQDPLSPDEVNPENARIVTGTGVDRSAALAVCAMVLSSRLGVGRPRHIEYGSGRGHARAVVMTAIRPEARKLGKRKAHRRK